MNPITATKDPTQTNNLLYGGTINIGNQQPVNTPITPALKDFNQQMVQGNKTPTIPASNTAVSNYGMASKVNDIIGKSTQLGVIKPPVQPQTNQQAQNNVQTGQTIDYSTAPYTTDQFGTKMYYNPSSGQYDQYQSTGGVVNYGGINVPSETLSDPSLKAIIDNQLQAKQENKTALDSELEAIKNRFVQYRDTQTKLNQSSQAGVQNALLQSGAGGRGSVAQYAAATADARVNVLVEDGLKAIQQLDNQEKELISAARSAYASENFKILSQINAAIEQKRQEQETKARELNSLIAKEQFAAETARKQATRDSAIADLYSQGITDPSKMLNYLNFDEQGNQIGDFTAKEIQDTMKNIASGLGTDVSGLDQTTKEFYRLKQVQGLPAYISSLPTEGEQLLSYVKARTGAETKGRTTTAGRVSGGVSTGGGISGTYLNDMEALGANARSMYKTKFAQEDFDRRWKSARDESDKIAILATAAASSLTGTERDDFTNQSKAMREIDKAIQMIDQGVKTGVIEAGKQYVYNTFGKDFDPKLARINQLITAAIQPYRNSVTGAAWGDQEDMEYANLFGSTKYSPAELKQRLEGVKEIMKDNSLTALNSKINPISTYSNPFESTGSQYIITQGDELRNIASKYGTTVDVIMALNPGISPNNLIIGSRLNLPIEGVHKNSQDPLNFGITGSGPKDPMGLGI